MRRPSVNRRNAAKQRCDNRGAQFKRAELDCLVFAAVAFSAVFEKSARELASREGGYDAAISVFTSKNWHYGSADCQIYHEWIA